MHWKELYYGSQIAGGENTIRAEKGTEWGRPTCDQTDLCQWLSSGCTSYCHGFGALGIGWSVAVEVVEVAGL